MYWNIPRGTREEKLRTLPCYFALLLLTSAPS
jgi:hypothetical protein